MQRPTKTQRDKYFRWLVANGLEIDGKHVDFMPPCRCSLELTPCECPDDACMCDLDFDVIDPEYEDCVCEGKGPCECRRCLCEWTADQTFNFRASLAILLATLDPATYADLPPPPKPIPTLSMESRLEFFEKRLEGGFHLHHPKDRSADDGREGELATRGMNGAAVRGKVGRVEESRFQARYAKGEKTAKRTLA